jgi:5'-nucleotidase
VASLGEVTIVAPDREQSASSSSLTLHNPLRARKARDGAWIVDGTPTDCVILGVNELLPDRPDICVSGVNHGSNMGEDVLYSGTVAAAMESTVMGIPAVALSYCGQFPEEFEGCESLRVTSLGKRRYADSITRAKDPSGKEYFWIGGGVVTWRGPEESDFQAVQDGYVSVTPLHLDLTNYKLLEDIRSWDLTL